MTVGIWQAVVNNLDDAHEQIDTAISTALKESKPAYISISCNLPGIPHPTFIREPVPFLLAPKYALLSQYYYNVCGFVSSSGELQ